MFNGVLGERVRIQMNKTAGGEPQFCLYRPDGTQVACPYDYRGNVTTIETTLDRSGVFRILAKEYGDNSTLSYLLSLNRIAPPLPSAQWISNYQNLPVEINPVGDNDFVYFNTCGTGRWAIRLTKTDGSQPQFCLYRPDGTQVACPYDYRGTSAHGEFEVTQSGAHGIGIYEYGENETLKANLSLTCLGGDCRNSCGTPIPTAPSNLAATAASTSQINLTWTDNSTNEQGFRIERRQGTGAWSQIATTGPSVTSFANTGLAASTTYSYRVVAYNATGNSSYSNTATATTSSRTTPDFVITSIVLTPVTPKAGATFTATITVRNLGQSIGNASYLDAWTNRSAAQGCFSDPNGWTVVGNLAAGASKTLTITRLRSGAVGAKTFRAFVDGECKTAETNETNNQRTLSYTVVP